MNSLFFSKLMASSGEKKVYLPGKKRKRKILKPSPLASVVAAAAAVDDVDSEKHQTAAS